MTTLLRPLVLALFLASLPASAELRVIQLQHRTGSEITRLLQPMLHNRERVADDGQQLILSADRKRLLELEQLIASLDRPLRRLLITLDDASTISDSSGGVEARGRVRGHKGEIILGDPGPGANRIHIRHYSTHDNSTGQRSVQTLEGSAAFIQTGQQIPQQQWGRDQYGRPAVHTVQRQLNQGFYVTPSIQGNQVTLELSSQNDQLSPQDSQIIEQKNLSTRVSGQLGQWIELGRINLDTEQQRSGSLSLSKHYSTKNNNLRIKVQLLDE